MTKFNELRMCRIDGQQPTAKERWIAFHRLWRLAQGRGPTHDMDAIDCFRVLFSNWKGIRLLDGDQVSIGSRTNMPKFLRRRMLKMDRRRRLHGEHYEWLERDRKVAARMTSEGKETTPEEVAAVRKNVIKHIRSKAEADGVTLPVDDVELMLWLSKGK